VRHEPASRSTKLAANRLGVDNLRPTLYMCRFEASDIMATSMWNIRYTSLQHPPENYPKSLIGTMIMYACIHMWCWCHSTQPLFQISSERSRATTASGFTQIWYIRASVVVEHTIVNTYNKIAIGNSQHYVIANWLSERN
jgi:hypothetical protein